MTKPAYQRVLLKLSGEALMGDDQFGINRATIDRMPVCVRARNAAVVRANVMPFMNKLERATPWELPRAAR